MALRVARTDIACVYRALWRSTYRAIRPQLTATDVEVLSEMVIEVLRARRRIIEIPVTYCNPDVARGGVRSPCQRPAVFRRILGRIARKRLSDTALARRLRRPIRPAASSSTEALRYKQLEKDWQDVVVRVLREERMSMADVVRTDFLAYPFTGGYAGSVFSRSRPLMGRLIALERRLAATPVLGRVDRALAWRFNVVAVKAA